MTHPKLLVTESDRFSPEAVTRLRVVAEVDLADLEREELLGVLEDVEVLWIRLRHQIDQEVFDRASQLKFICSPTTGLNHIDMNVAKDRSVKVISLRGEDDFLRDIRATAEHTIGLMLSLLRNLPAAIQHVRDGGWDRDLFCGHELHEKTIGIVGMGRLGRLVAMYLNAFGARVLAADPHVKAEEFPEDVQRVSLETLLAESDIVTLHVNLDEQTAGFFGHQQFASMRTGACFVNTSRGELIDETSLLGALKNGSIRGAALDVLRDEQSSGMAHHALVEYSKQHNHLLITPHLGGCTTESMAKTEIFLAEKLCVALQAS